MSPKPTPKSVRVLRPFGLLLSLAAVSLAACVATPTVAPATSTPIPPSATSAPATAVPASATPESPTDVPTAVPATETPAAPDVPEVISIFAPGLSSQVTSPVHVEGFSEPTFEQALTIEITDANGGVIGTAHTTIQADAGSAGPFSVDVAFTTPTDQPGRISVYDTSARDGGLLHLASVEVDLLAGGTAVVEAAPEAPEVHMILAPAPLAVVSGGTLHLEGYSKYVFEGTLNVWLCGEGGSSLTADVICGTADNVIATDFAMIQASDIGFDGPFTLEMPYTVAGTVQARLVVYSTSARDGGILHLSSVPITLNP